MGLQCSDSGDPAVRYHDLAARRRPSPFMSRNAQACDVHERRHIIVGVLSAVHTGLVQATSRYASGKAVCGEATGCAMSSQRVEGVP